MMQQTKNRWLIVLAAIGIHISIGSVYAWSVLTKPIMQAMGFSLKEVTWTFSLAILFLGTSAGFLGTYVEKYGPRRSGLISMCFFVSGLLGTAYALTQHSLLLLYLFYGVIGGIGLGTGYITPVSTLVKWFPNNRGLATGLAIMGFGFASLVAGPLMQILIAKYGLVENFVILACIYAVVMTASALYLEPPKQETAAGKGQFKAKMRACAVLREGGYAHLAVLCFVVDFLYEHHLRYRSFGCGFAYGTGGYRYVSDCGGVYGWHHRLAEWRWSYCVVHYFRLHWSRKYLSGIFRDSDCGLLPFGWRK